MAKTIRTNTSDGIQVLYSVDFDNGFIKREHVFVYLTENAYTTQVAYTFISDSQIQLTNPVALNGIFHIRRVVPRDTIVNDYTDGAVLNEKNLDDSYKQAIMILEEIEDGFITPDTILGDLINAGIGASLVQENIPVTTLDNGIRWYKPSEATTFVLYKDVDSAQWIEESPSVAESGIYKRTTTELVDITNTINTLEKFTGKEVFNTTLNRPVWSTGITTGSVWNFADGNLAHTPV